MVFCALLDGFVVILVLKWPKTARFYAKKSAKMAVFCGFWVLCDAKLYIIRVAAGQGVALWLDSVSDACA